jgi:hypothetical protein
MDCPHVFARGFSAVRPALRLDFHRADSLRDLLLWFRVLNQIGLRGRRRMPIAELR